MRNILAPFSPPEKVLLRLSRNQILWRSTTHIQWHRQDFKSPPFLSRDFSREIPVPAECEKYAKYSEINIQNFSEQA